MILAYQDLNPSIALGGAILLLCAVVIGVVRAYRMKDDPARRGEYRRLRGGIGIALALVALQMFRYVAKV